MDEGLNPCESKMFRFDVGLVDVVIFGCYRILLTFPKYRKISQKYILGKSAFKQNPFDPGGGHCYWVSIKPCKSNDLRIVANGSVTRG